MANDNVSENITAWVRRELADNTDPKYREFHKSLVPGLDNILGVRVPKLRQIAKKAAKDGYDSFAGQADIKVYEELMIRGMMIGYGKMDDQRRRRELDAFVPLINNWGICDCCCATYKFMEKKPKDWFDYLKKYAASDREYEIRFAVVCMLDFFLTDPFIDQVLNILGRIRHDGYYVKMAVAWAVSIAYIKYPEKTEVLFEKNILDDFTHNKAIQKIRESYRVGKEDKERLKLMRRPTSRRGAANDPGEITNRQGGTLDGGDY